MEEAAADEAAAAADAGEPDEAAGTAAAGDCQPEKRWWRILREEVHPVGGEMQEEDIERAASQGREQARARPRARRGASPPGPAFVRPPGHPWAAAAAFAGLGGTAGALARSLARLLWLPLQGRAVRKVLLLLSPLTSMIELSLACL